MHISWTIPQNEMKFGRVFKYIKLNILHIFVLLYNLNSTSYSIEKAGREV